MSSISLSHPTGVIEGSFLLPASKSISNRLLILQHLFPGRITIENLSEAEDTVILANALKVREGTVDVKHAGTCLRFLTAFYSCVPSDIILHGSPRLHKRPVGDLVYALRTLGADIDFIDEEGYAPLRIKGKKLEGNKVTIDGSMSSQHVSALMLIAPSLPDGLTIEITGKQVSTSYVQMTERLLFDNGILSTVSNNFIDIPPQLPRLGEILVEPDWSAASYWYAMAALSKSCDIRLPALTNSYLQGDIVISGYMERFGVNTSFEHGMVRLTKTNVLLEDAVFEMDHEPDLVPAMAAGLAGLQINVCFEGVGHLKLKESDRIEAISNELQKCGLEVLTTEDSIEIAAGKINPNVVPHIETYGDHRIAMAFATLALRFKQIQINHPEVVEKSYPFFWDELKKAGFVITQYQ